MVASFLSNDNSTHGFLIEPGTSEYNWRAQAASIRIYNVQQMFCFSVLCQKLNAVYLIERYGVAEKKNERRSRVFGLIFFILFFDPKT